MERDHEKKLKREKGTIMTREDIKKTFPEATDEQINAILNIHSTDIGKVKTAKEKAETDLKTATDTIKELEKNKQDVQALQKTIDDYKAADDKRQQAEKAAAEKTERRDRFDKAHEEAAKGRKWLNDFTRDGIFSQFEAALADETNKGKSDVQIYNALVNDEKGVKAGLFEAQVGGFGRMGGMGADPGSAQSYVNSKYKNNPFLNGQF